MHFFSRASESQDPAKSERGSFFTKRQAIHCHLNHLDATLPLGSLLAKSLPLSSE
ncbi:hypothetical protein DSO57_1002390 [Entomophthora muscae]|uniref:Uncharacterized protein n=1 Tax=Entomophthora muscae TaxID=34485 RepID=A0ACC2RNM4_9FUNG|nr:hypothetical protein DSO57_1002390 [Entomophthora muscae]